MRTVDKEMDELKCSSTNSLNIRNVMSGNGASTDDATTTGRNPRVIQIMMTGQIADKNQHKQL
jgi:hypothetical protein